MNRFAREMLRGGRDGRNPYGSRGGYVTSRDPRGRRDRGDYGDDDMDYRGGNYDGHYNREYEQYPYEEMRGSFEYDRQYYDGNRPYDMRDYRGGRYDYGDDYDDYGDYRGRRRNSRGQYMRDGRRDYGDDDMTMLSKRDVKDWEEDMENNDGSRGFHFSKEQAEQAAMQIGFDPKSLGDEHSFWVAMNLEYSDGCLTAKKFGVDRPEYFAEKAKEALTKDKDFEGKGAEKLFLYYKFIASKD